MHRTFELSECGLAQPSLISNQSYVSCLFYRPPTSACSVRDTANMQQPIPLAEHKRLAGRIPASASVNTCQWTTTVFTSTTQLKSCARTHTRSLMCPYIRKGHSTNMNNATPWPWLEENCREQTPMFSRKARHVPKLIKNRIECVLQNGPSNRMVKIEASTPHSSA